MDQHHSSQDRALIQPGSDLRHHGRASGNQVSTTPVGRSYPFQRDGHRTVPTSPESGITLHLPEALSTPGSSRRINPPRKPWSSQRANIGIRRAHQNSMLLGSPARPSHVTRMRQDFEDASLEDALSQRNDGVGLYPQLPNIYRPCPPGSRIPASRSSTPNFSRLGSPTLSTQVNESLSVAPPKIGLLLQARARSPSLSESWSGDSDYLVTEPPPPAPSPPAFSLPIKEWLATVSLEDSFAQETISAANVPMFSDIETSLPSQKKLNPLVPKKCKNRLPRSALLRDSGSSLQVSSKSDPFHPCDENLGSFLSRSNGLNITSSPLRDTTNQPKPYPLSSPQELYDVDNGGVELSFLSPNVCTERGPSRYRSLQGSRSPLYTSQSFHKGTSRLRVRQTATCSTNKSLDTADEAIPQKTRTLRILGTTPKNTRFWQSPGAGRDVEGVHSNEN